MKHIPWLLTFVLYSFFFIHSVKAENNQLSFYATHEIDYSHSDDPIALFCTPIVFTRAGISDYLKLRFNRKEYVSDFLPHNLKDYIEFLQWGVDQNIGKTYIQCSTRLFLNKLKQVRYINAFALSTMLEKLPELLGSYFKPQEESLFNTIKSSINKILYSMFLSHFAKFKQEPDAFFDELTQEIVKATQHDCVIEEVKTIEHLRHTIIRFLETALGKVIWCPMDQEEVWNCVKTISNHLVHLADQSIITTEDLDDLFKSLLERFCHFLELAGSDLSLEAIEKIKEDLIQNQLYLFTLEEQEEFMETKKERLLRAAIATEARIHARSKGIITEVMAY